MFCSQTDGFHCNFSFFAASRGELNPREIKGKVEGKIEERLAIARNLLNLGLSENLIAQATGLSPEAIRELT